jgi:hypothetical protein
METKVLGNSDLRITPIGFGAWAIGGDWEFGWGAQDDAQSIAAIHRALELGVNWIDTAAVYGLGHSEETVARALEEWHGPRPYVFTKCGMIWNAKGKVDYSLRQESIRRECEASLRRLKTDLIDLFQIHWTADDLNETLEGWATLLALQKEGKVHWIGLSNASVEEIPERVVHAKGAGAYGTFTVTHDITQYTSARLFNAIGKQTAMFARFSTVAGEKGSADTARDPRGFALKFYTEEGNWDMVGSNTPIFFVRDGLKFGDFIHSQKRVPGTNLRSPIMMWDFWSLFAGITAPGHDSLFRSRNAGRLPMARRVSRQTRSS